MVRKAARKERITVSISRESARFLRSLRAETHCPSTSALLERMIANARGKTEMERLDERTQAYYDALPDAAMREDHAWGAVGEAALAKETQAKKARRDDPRPRLRGAR